MKQPCEFCLEPIDTRGMLSHIHHRHRYGVSHRFNVRLCTDPTLCVELGTWPPRFPHKQLMAPNPLTVYSTRPLGKMAAPIPQLRRPKGYCPGYGYARPADLLASQRRYGYLFS